MNHYKALALDALDVGTNAHNGDIARRHLALAQVYATLAVLETLEAPHVIEDTISLEELKAEVGL